MVQLKLVTVQQDSRQPINSSAKAKSPLLTVQLKPVTVQQDLRQPVNRSARENSPCQPFSKSL